MKKFLCVFLVLSICLFPFLSGCSNNDKNVNDQKDGEIVSGNDNSEKKNSEKETSSKEDVTIRFMAYNKEETRKTYLEMLETELPHITIDFQFVDQKQFNNILNTQLAAKEGPDLIEGGGNTTTLAAAGYLADLTSESFIDKYNETGLTAYTYEDKIYGIPLQSWFEGIYYNKKIFKEHNLTPPKTLDEWITIHEKLEAEGIKPQTMGAKSWEPMMKQSIGLVLNEFYSTDAAKGFDNDFNKGDKTLDGNWNVPVKEWSKLIEKGCLEKEMLGLDYDQALDEFVTEKAAMWESGPWALETIKSKNSDLEIGMFPIPGIQEGTGWLVGGPGSALCINVASKHQDALLEILELTSTPEAQEALVKDNKGSSFLKGVDVDLGSEFEDCAEAFKEGHVYAPWLYWLGGDAIVMEYGKSLQEVLSGEISTDDAIKVADKKATEMRKAMNKN